MIKKLQHRFVLVIMTLLIILYAVIIGSVNFFSYQSGQKAQLARMEQLAERDGRQDRKDFMGGQEEPPLGIIPDDRKENMDSEFPFLQEFSVKVDRTGSVIAIDINPELAYTQENIEDLVEETLEQNAGQGKIGSFVFLIKDKPYGKIIVFASTHSEMSFSNRLLNTSVLVGGVSLFIMFFVAWWLSRIVTRPIQKTFEKQKQFVSDASHELKTPITVIQTNADVLQNEIGENKWLSFIQSECTRMSKLVNNLLVLARLDDREEKLAGAKFDLSKAVLQMALSFESVAFEQNKQFFTDICPGVFMEGHENEIQQVVSILLDNAIKHANEQGEVRISLYKHGGKRVIEVQNTGAGIKPEDYSKIFERFYRADNVRNSTSNSYGLGLSIAQTIVQKNKGKILIEGDYGRWVKFSVVF